MSRQLCQCLCACDGECGRALRAQVSLDSRVREGINQNLAEPSNLMYEEAQFQIYTLMHRDSFPRFLNSSVYRDYLATRRRLCLDT